MKRLAILGIYLIPFTSITILPTTYRPVSVLFLLIPGLLYLLSTFKKEEMYDILLFIFIVYISVYSLVLYEVFDFSQIYLLKSVVVLFLGCFAYFGFNYAFERMGHFNFFRTVRILVNIFLIVATLDLLFFLLNDLFGLRSLLQEIIAGKKTSRPQYTTGESAWAAQIILFLIPIQTWIYHKTGFSRDKIKTGYLYLLLMLTFSLVGYVYLMLYIPVIYFYKNRNKLKSAFKIVAVSAFFLAAMYGTFSIYSQQGGYYINRINQLFSEAKFTDIYDIDASTYIRTLYPKVGYDIFLDYPLGIGAGGYGIMFGDYIVRYDYEMLHNSQTQRNIREKNTDPKNLYSKLLSEFGIINTLLFTFLIIMIGKKKDKYLLNRDKSSKIFLFSLNTVTFLIFLQFSSLAYIPFWFVLALNKHHKLLIHPYKSLSK